MFFGIISPNINITIVTITVATSVATASSVITAKVIKVTSDEAKILTTLFPINNAINDWSYLFISLNASFALWLPSSAFNFNLTLFAQVNAVSTAEKNALHIIKIITTHIKLKKHRSY